MTQSITHKKEADGYYNRRQLDAAAASYRQAIACNPNYAEAHNNLSNVYRELNLIKDAEHHLKEAIKSKPGFANFYYNLASLQMTQGKLNDAIENFRQALKCKTDHHAARAIMLFLLQKICNWSNVESDIKALRHSVSITTGSAESIFSPFIFITLPRTTAAEQKLCAEKWVQTEYQSLQDIRHVLAFDHERPRNDKICIGYLSADFHDHATARLIAEVVELHDRNQFTITAYSYGPDDGSEMRKRLQDACDHFEDIQELSDVDSARKIYQDHVDILVDLKGLTQNCRSGILALHPAPLQVNYLGYPGTMGAAFVEYLIADPFVVPPEHQKHYTEKIVYLQDCYQPNDRKRRRPPAPARSDCGLPEEHFIFCCFNQTYKITPEIFDIWCRLLVAVPQSVIWLLASTPDAEANLKLEAEIRHVNPNRLLMAPSLNPDAHLARLQCADLFLDTMPVNAHTTCSDALWMGLPLVTCVGETFPSRVAGSLLSAIKLPELITYNLEDYYHLALALATNRGKLDAIRGKLISNRESTPLFDSVRFTRGLEDAYLRIVSHPRPHF
jgi:protein O-GlcNAc transferase